MSLKSSRGIQPEDVVQAADALIAEGLRPTIERVRQKIGRGSPNTVSPLLDAWFATLAGRLGLDGAQQEQQLPEPVQQAASQLWASALLIANEEAQKTLASAHEAIAAERAELRKRETDFEYQKQALIVRQMAADEALRIANSQLSEKTVRLEDAWTLLNRQARDIDVLREKLLHSEAEREAALRRNEEETRRHAEERTRLEARAMANERRLLEELDRERQDVKQANAVLTALKATNLNLVMQRNASEHELKVSQQTLTSATLRASELSDLLEAQKSAHATTLKQLDLFLTGASRKLLKQPMIRRRRLGI